MFSRKKFPFLSTIVVAVLAVCVAGEIQSNQELTSRVFSQMTAAANQFLRCFNQLAGTSIAEESFVFSNGVLMTAAPQGVSEGGQFVDAPAQQPDAAAVFAPAAETLAPQPQSTSPLEQETADPVPLLVNAWNPLPDDYVPEDLVLMREYCGSDIVYIKGSEIEGCRKAVDALMTMLSAARAEGLDNWQVSAGYRSIAYQQQLMDNKVYEYRQQGLSGSDARSAAERYVATPGCSEHHTGLAFDITVAGQSFASTKQCAWLQEHCWEYGFILRYTEEKESITGIAAEAWHFRYVGQPHALIMRDNGWCLEEYIDSLG